jgi:hypothetical protein
MWISFSDVDSLAIGHGIQAVGRSSHKLIEVVMQSTPRGKVCSTSFLFFLVVVWDPPPRFFCLLDCQLSPVVTPLRSGHQICEVIGKLQIQKESRGNLEIARWLESCRYKKKAKGAWRLRGDWKAADTKRKQRELRDCSIDDVRFWQLLRGNKRKNSRSWIVFGTSSSRGQFSGPRQTDGQTSEIIYRISIKWHEMEVTKGFRIPYYECLCIFTSYKHD